MSKANESAFPISPACAADGRSAIGSYEAEPGLTKREYFAAMAMQGFCANPAVHAPNGMTGWGLVNCDENQLAMACLEKADALLARLAHIPADESVQS